MKASTPPKSVDELLNRAHGLAGLTLAEIARECGLDSPDSLTRGKGWTGQVCELLLGSDAGCDSAPDFTALGIELKTLPIDAEGKVIESTFVCTIPLLDIAKQTWLQSNVYQKLKHVLWLPIICPQKESLLERQIGMPLLWQPSMTQLQTLEGDWQELTNMIALGELAQITASLGEALHIRPKGANAKALVWGFDEEGNKSKTLPRGFYLRSQFTQTILSESYHRQY